MSKLIILSVNYNWAKKLEDTMKSKMLTVSEAASIARGWGFSFNDSWDLANWASSL